MKIEKTKDGFKQIDWFYLYNLYKVKNPDVDSITYKKVIACFFDIYFSELYFLRKPKYFFLSGMIRKAKGRKFYSYKTEKVQRHYGINLIWYNRPSLSWFANVKMMKTTSTLSVLQSIEQAWRKKNDVELLPSLSSLIQSLKLYKND